MPQTFPRPLTEQNKASIENARLLFRGKYHFIPKNIRVLTKLNVFVKVAFCLIGIAYSYPMEEQPAVVPSSDEDNVEISQYGRERRQFYGVPVAVEVQPAEDDDVSAEDDLVDSLERAKRHHHYHGHGYGYG